MDLFGPSLMDDLVDTTASTSRALPRAGIASVPEVDLFANADFHSATPATGSHAQVYPILVSSDTFLIIHFILHILQLFMLHKCDTKGCACCSLLQCRSRKKSQTNRLKIFSWQINITLKDVTYEDPLFQ